MTGVAVATINAKETTVDQQDYEEFNKLIKTHIRSEEREKALEDWQSYKHSRQVAYILRRKEKNPSDSLYDDGLWTKDDEIDSLTAPAIDLKGAVLKDVCVGRVDLRGAILDSVSFTHEKLSGCTLRAAKLQLVSFRKAQMANIGLMDADLSGANLEEANLSDADLSGSNLSNVNFYKADLTRANLQGANISGANLEGCKLDGARVYGIAAWDLKGTPISSKDLIVTPEMSGSITTDDIRVAQFIYLLVNNPEIRNVLDAVTKKVVLILGRFKPDRKIILNALRNSLREHDFVPVLFDFEKAADRDITETITLLARMARYVIADLTEPSSIPQELQAIAPDVAVPIRLILQKECDPYSMSRDLKKYQWVIKPYRYDSLDDLLNNLEDEVIDIAEKTRIKIEKLRLDDEW